MFSKRNRNNADSFVELPNGIFTAEGVWFHTNEALVREFANELVDRVGLNKLLSEAVAWTKSAEAVGALVLMGTLLVTHPLFSLLLSLVAYIIWFMFTPLLVVPALTGVITAFSKSLAQGLLFILGISWLGQHGQFLAVGVGLAGFVLLRWGVISRLVEYGFGDEQYQKLPREDRIFKSLLMRKAISLGINLPVLESFEDRICEIWQRGERP